MPTERLLRCATVLSMLGVHSPATLWHWVKEGAFPQPVQVSPRLRGWRESEVQAWIEARPNGSGKAPTAAQAARRANIQKRRAAGIPERSTRKPELRQAVEKLEQRVAHLETLLNLEQK